MAALKEVYKAIFLKKLRLLLFKKSLTTTGIDTAMLIKKAGIKKWNVYAKSPFGSVASVIEYLGRYTHKTAITKHRISSITDHSISFSYKDYADAGKKKTMTLGIPEFLRRFEQHFLPHRYVKIRHYVFLQNYNKTTRLNAARLSMNLQPLPPRILIPVQQRMLEQYGRDITLCPQCGKGTLVLIAIVYTECLPVAVNINREMVLHNKASP